MSTRSLSSAVSLSTEKRRGEIFVCLSPGENELLSGGQILEADAVSRTVNTWAAVFATGEWVQRWRGSLGGGALSTWRGV